MVKVSIDELLYETENTKLSLFQTYYIQACAMLVYIQLKMA